MNRKMLYNSYSFNQRSVCTLFMYQHIVPTLGSNLDDDFLRIIPHSIHKIHTNFSLIIVINFLLNVYFKIRNVASNFVQCYMQGQEEATSKDKSVKNRC